MNYELTMDDLCILLHRVKSNIKRCKEKPLGTEMCRYKTTCQEIRKMFIELEIRDRLRKLHA